MSRAILRCNLQQLVALCGFAGLAGHRGSFMTSTDRGSTFEAAEGTKAYHNKEIKKRL